MGIDSRRPAPMGVGGNPGPNGLPLLARFSAARSTSAWSVSKSVWSQEALRTQHGAQGVECL